MVTRLDSEQLTEVGVEERPWDAGRIGRLLLLEEITGSQLQGELHTHREREQIGQSCDPTFISCDPTLLNYTHREKDKH